MTRWDIDLDASGSDIPSMTLDIPVPMSAYVRDLAHFRADVRCLRLLHQRIRVLAGLYNRLTPQFLGTEAIRTDWFRASGMN